MTFSIWELMLYVFVASLVSALVICRLMKGGK